MVAFTIALVDPAGGTKNEGDIGKTDFVFRITRVGEFDPNKEYRVPVRLVPDQQQTDIYDFIKFDPRFGSGQVEFRGNETFQDITIQVTGDKLVELNEIIRVSITGYQVYNLDGTLGEALPQSVASAVAVVLNDDLPADHKPYSEHIALAQAQGDAVAIASFAQPPTADQLMADAKAAAAKQIAEAKKDGKLTPEEMKALGDAFNGYGFDADLADDIKKAALDLVAAAINRAIKDKVLTASEKEQIKAAASGLGFDEDIQDAIDKADAALGNASFDDADLYYVLSFPGATDVKLGDAGLDVALMGRSVEDIASVEDEGGIFTITLRDEQVLLFQEVEYLQLVDGILTLDSEKNIPAFDPSDLLLVASTYQFFTGSIPTAGGFEYLISSPENETDLNDPYYEIFNEENLFINFANNLGSVGIGREAFAELFGALSFEDTVTAAYDLIIGFEEAEAAGIDVDAALAFLRGARPFYESVALQRVVSADVPLDQAVKIVAIGSVLYEALKSGIGLYADAVEEFLADVLEDGESELIGEDLFAIA